MPCHAKLLGFLAMCLFAAACNAAGDWPQFRGPSGQGVSDAKGVPVQWGTDINIAWKAPIAGAGWSSPVVMGGRVYLTAAVPDGTGLGLNAICLDAASGKVIWNVPAIHVDANAAKAMHKKNSPASSTPIVTADRLYVHFGYMGTAALDLKGNVLWRQTSIKYAPVHGNGSSPVLAGNTLIFSCDGAVAPFLAAVDALTGDVKWKTPRNAGVARMFSFATPLAIEVDGKMQVISPCSGMVGAYDPADGKEIWRVRYGQGYSVVPRPVYAHGLIFLSSGFDTAVLYAINPSKAAGDVTDTHVAWTGKKAAPNTPSPLVVGDELYLVSDGGIATCWDAKSGQQHWTHRLDGGFSSSPVYADGKVYFQNETGVGYVVKAAKTFELLAENDLEEKSLASYAVEDGAIYIRTEGHLWKVGKGK